MSRPLLILLQASLLIIMSCATQNNGTKKTSAFESDAIVGAIEYGSPAKLKEIPVDELSGQSDLHILMAQSCHLSIPADQVEKTLYLVSKDALPVEKEVIHNRIVGSNGPLGLALQRGCKELADVYLQTMTPEDIAKGSLAFQPQTSEDFARSNQILDPVIAYNNMVNYVISDVNNIADTVMGAVKKNNDLCKAGKDINCGVPENLSKKLGILYREAIAVSAINICAGESGIRQEQDLMQKQVEFGAKTGVASPKTYDYHAQKAQQREELQSPFIVAYKNLTGKDPDLKKCDNLKLPDPEPL